VAPLKRRGAGAFTLLEVLLAIALLGVLGALIATMWAQARDWTLENASAQRVLRLPRVVELLRTQWADRRATIGNGRASDSVQVFPNEVAFTTATPILFPDWPLVTAVWRVERDGEASNAASERFLLRYEEHPVTSFDEPPQSEGEAQEAPEDARNRRQRLASESRVRIEPRSFVVLRGAESLAVERWGPGYRFESLGLRPSSLRDERNAGKVDADGPVPEGPDAWRAIEPEYEGVPPAVRLSGTHEGKRFECTLIVGDSR